MGNIIFYDLLDPNKTLKAEVKDRLWSVDGYTKVELERIYPHYHPIDGDKNTRDIRGIRRWIEQHCEFEVIIKQYTVDGSLYVFAYFESEEEAIQCKLMWYE